MHFKRTIAGGLAATALLVLTSASVAAQERPSRPERPERPDRARIVAHCRHLIARVENADRRDQVQAAREHVLARCRELLAST